MSCKRNAFMMLIHADQDRALNFLSSCIEQVQNFGDILQLVIVELIYKVCLANPTERSRFIRCIYNLLNSNSASVRYEAAGTLVRHCSIAQQWRLPNSLWLSSKAVAPVQSCPLSINLIKIETPLLPFL